MWASIERGFNGQAWINQTTRGQEGNVPLGADERSFTKETCLQSKETSRTDSLSLGEALDCLAFLFGDGDAMKCVTSHRNASPRSRARFFEKANSEYTLTDSRGLSNPELANCLLPISCTPHKQKSVADKKTDQIVSHQSFYY